MELLERAAATWEDRKTLYHTRKRSELAEAALATKARVDQIDADLATVADYLQQAADAAR